MKRWLTALLLLAAQPAHAQLDGNNDEAKVPAYTLPDPLRFADGSPVQSARDWPRRRAELVRLFERNVYGFAPPAPKAMRFTVAEQGPAFGGTAIRRQVTIYLTGAERGPQMQLLLYLPANAKGRVPVFLGPNFHGNQAVTADPAVAITPSWVVPATGIVKGRATLASRGIDAGQWPIEHILAAGYGVATWFTGDLYPDNDNGFVQSIQPELGTSPLDPSHWGAVATWAWGLSRALDYLATDAQVDGKRVVVIGHSRYGKAALWAGAHDPRFAAAIANDSGEGGASLYRRRFGETIRVMNSYWFAPLWKTYAERESDLPVDANELVALVAPRPVYIASASEDWWSDPHGEFLAAQGADPVYRLLGVEGMAANAMPAPGEAVLSRIAYHLRTGPHDITFWDWDHYLAFADRYVRKD